MSVCAALTNLGLLFGRARTMQASDVGLLFGLGLYLRLVGSLFELGSLEGNARHHGLRDFFVRSFTCNGHIVNVKNRVGVIINGGRGGCL